MNVSTPINNTKIDRIYAVYPELFLANNLIDRTERINPIADTGFMITTEEKGSRNKAIFHCQPISESSAIIITEVAR